MSWFEDYFAAWESGDVERVVAWFAPDGMLRDMAFGHEARGHDALRTFAATSFAVVPEARFDVVEGTDDGDRWAVRWVMQPWGVPGVSFGRRVDGLIVEQRDFWDRTGSGVPGTDQPG